MIAIDIAIVVHSGDIMSGGRVEKITIAAAAAAIVVTTRISVSMINVLLAGQHHCSCFSSSQCCSRSCHGRGMLRSRRCC